MNHNRPNLSITLNQFCSYLFEILINYEMPLTVRQFLKIEKHLRTKYNVDHFSAFKFHENDDDNTDVNLVSFLDKHQTLIDPHGELSVYGYNVHLSDRQEMFEFVNQLIESNHDRRCMSSQPGQFDTNADDENIQINADKLPILEKVVAYKFGELFGFQKGMNILRKIKQSCITNEHPIIR